MKGYRHGEHVRSEFQQKIESNVNIDFKNSFIEIIRHFKQLYQRC
jgi:hypothetical protein